MLKVAARNNRAIFRKNQRQVVSLRCSLAWPNRSSPCLRIMAGDSLKLNTRSRMTFDEDILAEKNVRLAKKQQAWLSYFAAWHSGKAKVFENTTKPCAWTVRNLEKIGSILTRFGIASVNPHLRLLRISSQASISNEVSFFNVCLQPVFSKELRLVSTLTPRRPAAVELQSCWRTTLGSPRCCQKRRSATAAAALGRRRRRRRPLLRVPSSRIDSDRQFEKSCDEKI